jgi:hypothetical protein
MTLPWESTERKNLQSSFGPNEESSNHQDEESVLPLQAQERRQNHGLRGNISFILLLFSILFNIKLALQIRSLTPSTNDQITYGNILCYPLKIHAC